MDKFSEKIAKASNIAIRHVLFEQLNTEVFEKVEKAFQTEIDKEFGYNTVIRWTDHSLKFNKNTFSSTFTIKDEAGNVRKYTVSPESTMTFDDLVNPDNDVTAQVKKF